MSPFLGQKYFGLEGTLEGLLDQAPLPDPFALP